MQQKLKMTVIIPKFIPAAFAKWKVRMTRQKPQNLLILMSTAPLKTDQSKVLSSSLKKMETSFLQKNP